MDLEAGFRLGGWQVQPDRNRLVKNGSGARLTPRAMQVLLCLADRAGEVVTREDFSERVWHPAVVTDDALTRVISELRRILGDRTGEPKFIETIPKRGYRLVAPIEPLAPDTGVAADRETAGSAIAVLPFHAIGAGVSESIADGIHQDLLTRLSEMPELKVISGTSVRRYRDTEHGVPEIADQLGVAWILEGSVQQNGETVQVNAQLIDAAADHHKWARTYSKAFSTGNLFRIQREIMHDIAGSLNATLLPDRHDRSPPVEDLEAYGRCMQGRSFLDTRTPDGMQQALVYFRAALERDRDYALAWVGIADALMLLYDYYDRGRPESVRRDVEKALGRAMDIDAELAEAHASTGLYHMCHGAAGPLRADGLDGPAAVRSLRRAFDLRPGYAEAYNWLSWVLQLLGEADQALVCADRAVSLNPLSPEAIHNLMSSNMACGHFGRGVREARRIEELGMFDASPRFYEAMALHHLGRFDAAVELLDGLTVEWSGAGAEAALAAAEAARGNGGRARELLGLIEETGDPFAAAIVRAAMGEHDDAIAAMEAIEQWGQWPALVLHHYYPDELSPLRDSPRFDAVMASLRRYYGLPADGERPDDFEFDLPSG
ncbi:MAG: winged helix-turn-helix domain-containing tetratricopeptide repeat protein [Candidatus Wenzhouxiangella sp. M2_3B_020]